MSFINIEFKARTLHPGDIRQYLLDHGAEYRGTDVQTDTYFKVPNGRLKLREGHIEKNLIWYQRSNQAGPKQADCLLTPVAEANSLRQTLIHALGIKVTVVKKREIYFIGNVKFHIDELDSLGTFVEVEASNKNDDLPVEKLREQCEYYRQAFGVADDDLIQVSYSDMLLEKSGDQE
ncbi:class IV adenylate cyclase [Paraflavitalea sp. CAU 1676]|uniref:class IV adenylate cyclase n=1 Tax=Paraflavitalea sp. CAU 1676 TaxID=3032598 RepID=UPI0023D9DB1B|nr:class IV adenylate cyclase [Paraflavitalea sp. CAU 1676]MDF2188984.1 class IV adenylate cyclase [Paraflavitalea sp. CAU 1676]